MIIFAVFITQTLYMITIAIDPDVDKNGVAIFNNIDNQLELHSFTFGELIDYLLILSNKDVCQIIIEGGWLNHSNWHLSYRDSKRVACAKGNSTGRSHEVGRKIAELCEHWNINHRVIKPLRKCWKGKDGKITHDEIKSVLNGMNIKCPSRTNQEERDATLIAITYGR